MKGTSRNSVSLAGEFAVLSQLALRGYDANMTLGHTKGVDILVSNPKNGKSYQLEVKTTCTNSRNKASVSKLWGESIGSWIMNKNHERVVSPKLFYCFVTISKDDRSFSFYIVPNKVVARYVAEQHKLWLREKKKQGKKVKDTHMRTFQIGLKGQEYPMATPTAEQYEDNWRFAD